MESKTPVTQQDIARVLGVSHAAVSMALRDSPKIRKELREQIQEKATEMGYILNPLASGLALRKGSTLSKPVEAALGWVNFWPKPERLHNLAEFELYQRGASAISEKFGYRIEEFIGNNLPPKRLESVLLARGINGIFLPPHRIQPDWGDFQWDRFSVVRFGRSLRVPRSHLVTADQVANSILAFTETQRRGYQRIGFITSGNKELADRTWLFDAGFLRAQQSLDKKLRIPVFSLADPSSDYPSLIRWLKTQKPDAILTDVRIVPDLLKKAGYHVPDDIGLATMSVLDGGSDAGIDQNAAEIGRVAFLLILSLINDNAKGEPPILRQVLVEGNWVDGTMLPWRV